jgi:hypothetical protein
LAGVLTEFIKISAVNKILEPTVDEEFNLSVALFGLREEGRIRRMSKGQLYPGERLAHQMKLLAIVAILVSSIGCATKPMPTHIQSDPPGARIEVNEAAVGLTPVDVTLPQTGSHHRLKEHITIRALPAGPGQYEQEKQFYYNQWAPENVLFEKSAAPASAK